MRKLLITLATLLALSTHAAPPDFSALEKTALRELKEQNISGAAIAVVRGDRVVFARGFGASITPATPFRTDLTQLFTAAALVTAAEEGKLKLDQPIGNYVKGLPPRLAPVTLHMLLTHTAGLSDAPPAPDGKRAWDDSYNFVQPGQLFSVSGPGYELAGQAIGADYVRTRVLTPLGMSKTTPEVTSINDLARFAIAFLNGGRIDGKQVLPRAAPRKMSLPYTNVMASARHYAYGLMTSEEDVPNVLETGGLTMLLEQRVAVIYLTSKAGAELPRSVARALELAGAPLPSAAPAKEDPPMTAAEMSLACGTYANPHLGSIDVRVEGGRLVHKLTGFDARFENVGVESPLPPSLRFIRSVNGSVLYIYWRERAFRKMRGCE